MSENKIGFALVHEICPICGKPIIKLRSDSAAHPNAQIISNMIKKELESLGYDFN